MRKRNWRECSAPQAHDQEVLICKAPLKKSGLLTSKNLKSLLANAQYAEGLGLGLASLQRTGILTQPNRDALLANAQYAEGLGEGLAYLQWTGILTQPNFKKILLGKGAHARALVSCCKGLERHGVKLTQREFDGFMECLWREARLTATILGQLNSDQDSSLHLPPDVIQHIARNFMPDYSGDQQPPYSLNQLYERAQGGRIL